MKNKIIPYNPKLREYARKLRKQQNLSEVLFWKAVRKKAHGVEFHRQVPIDNYIVDFYCHELFLAVEIDGKIHDLEKNRIKDAIRQKRLESFGVTFIRFSDWEVKADLNSVLIRLKDKIKEIGADIPRHFVTPPLKGEYFGFPNGCITVEKKSPFEGGGSAY